MRYAVAKREGSNFAVYVFGKRVKGYSSPDNAITHAEQIERAILYPEGLNQRPERKKR